MRVEVKKTLFGKLVVTYDCPGCGVRLRSPSADVSMEDSCSTCGIQFRVPGKSAIDQIERMAEADAEQRKAVAEEKAKKIAERRKAETEEKSRQIAQRREAEALRIDIEKAAAEAKAQDSKPQVSDGILVRKSTLLAVSGVGAIIALLMVAAFWSILQAQRVPLPVVDGAKDVAKEPVEVPVPPAVAANPPAPPEVEEACPFEVLGVERIEMTPPTDAETQMAINYRLQTEINRTEQAIVDKSNAEANAYMRRAREKGIELRRLPPTQYRPQKKLFSDQEKFKQAEKTVSRFEIWERDQASDFKELSVLGELTPVMVVPGYKGYPRTVFRSGSLFCGRIGVGVTAVCRKTDFGGASEVILKWSKYDMTEHGKERVANWLKKLDPNATDRINEKQNIVCFPEKDFFVLWKATSEYLPPDDGRHLTIKEICEFQLKPYEERVRK